MKNPFAGFGRWWARAPEGHKVAFGIGVFLVAYFFGLFKVARPVADPLFGWYESLPENGKIVALFVGWFGGGIAAISLWHLIPVWWNRFRSK